MYEGIDSLQTLIGLVYMYQPLTLVHPTAILIPSANAMGRRIHGQRSRLSIHKHGAQTNKKPI